MVQENAACFFDATGRELDPDPVFLPEELEKIELAFISELPPNDGHKRNKFLDIPMGPERGAYAEDTARLIDAEVKRIMTEAHAEARRILTERRDQLESVTRRLPLTRAPWNLRISAGSTCELLRSKLSPGP